MKDTELYEALDKAGIKFEVVRIEEGLREIAVMVDEEESELDYDALPDWARGKRKGGNGDGTA